MIASDPTSAALRVLHEFGLEGGRLSPIAAGHINRTFLVERGAERWILQRVNPIFGPEVHEDIEAVTRYLEGHDVLTPLLVRTREAGLFARDGEQAVWRVLTYVEGVTHARADSPELCHAAGLLVGRFHRVVSELRHSFRHRRPYVHDTPRHLAHLRETLTRHAGHNAFAAVEPVGREILQRAQELPSFDALPRRIVHGDLKLTNILFSPAGEARVLIDLDTLAEMNLAVELGDAWRSWCNTGSEDALDCTFDLPRLEAALVGWREHGAGLVTPGEREALAHAPYAIALELAARFCADALAESYFGWDRQRFPSASAHNLARARGQLLLARSLAEKAEAVRRLVGRVLT